MRYGFICLAFSLPATASNKGGGGVTDGRGTFQHFGKPQCRVVGPVSMIPELPRVGG
jgi:hypothetical protein